MSGRLEGGASETDRPVDDGRQDDGGRPGGRTADANSVVSDEHEHARGGWLVCGDVGLETKELCTKP